MYVQYGCHVTAVRRSVTLVNSLLALRHEGRADIKGWTAHDKHAFPLMAKQVEEQHCSLHGLGACIWGL